MVDEDGRNWLSCLGWGCLTVVVVAALGIGGCVAVVYQGGKGAHSAAEAYLAAVDDKRLDEAFAILGSDFTDQRGFEEFTAFERAARAETGRCESWRARGTSFNRENGRSTSLLRYDGSCEAGPVTVSFRLDKIDGGWVIQDIRYNETTKPVALVCSGCGLPTTPAANFCANCGAAIGDS